MGTGLSCIEDAVNLKASRGSLCVRMRACFNAKVTKQNPGTLLTAELGFFGVCSQIFFFAETGFVVFPECGSKALPRERRGSLGLAHRLLCREHRQAASDLHPDSAVSSVLAGDDFLKLMKAH